MNINMSDYLNNHVLIVAGGTGGHIFPGLALAKELKRTGLRLSWLGTSRGLEKKIVAEENIPLFISNFKGVRGKGFLSSILMPWHLFLSILNSFILVRKIKPDCIACFGGYVSVPVGITSALLRIPIFIHEQNAIMGSANRLLAKLAKSVFLSFENTKHAPINGKFVGNLVRSSFTSVDKPEKRWFRRSGPFRILVLGGSLGAKILNTKVPKILAKANNLHNIDFDIFHQCGEKDVHLVEGIYKTYHLKSTVIGFVDDILEKYCWADLVICRSGAGTVSEIASVGIGSILIPLANSIDNHQFLNAGLLLEEKAALVVEEKNIFDGSILSFFKNIDRPTLLEYARKAQKCCKPNSASLIAKEIIKVIENLEK